MSDLEPLDAELEELFARERGAYPEDFAARDAVLRGLQTAILLAPLAAQGATVGAGSAAGGASAKAAAGVLGWKGVAIVATIAFGGGVAAGEAHHLVSAASRPPAPVVVATTTAPTSSPSVTATVDNPVPVVAISSLPVDRLPATAPSASSAPTPSVDDVRAERALIDTARTALARGLAAEALSTTDLHAKRFPRGRLAEEREAIAIQALAAKGDAAAARARAERFRRSFPNSIFRSAVDAAVGDGLGASP